MVWIVEMTHTLSGALVYMASLRNSLIQVATSK